MSPRLWEFIGQSLLILLLCHGLYLATHWVFNRVYRTELTGALEWKKAGDKYHTKGKLRHAILAYGRALTASDQPDDELKQILYSNRSLCYFELEAYSTCLRDIEAALALKPTHASDVTKSKFDDITRRLYYRKAKAHQESAFYKEALGALDAFEKAGGVSSTESEELRKLLQNRVSGKPHPRYKKKQAERDALLRAIEHRSLQFTQPYRKNFPEPPSNAITDHIDELIAFDQSRVVRPLDSWELPLTAPLSFPCHISAPFFKPTPEGAWITMTENMSLSDVLGNLFKSMFAYEASRRWRDAQQLAMTSVAVHEDERRSSIFTMTERGRICRIPRKTTLADVIKGTAWPTVPGAPSFEDSRKAAREDSNRSDGVGLVQGYFISFVIIPHENEFECIRRLEEGFSLLDVRL